VDGIFGPEPEEAVVRFQQRARLVADRIVGPLTWNALPDGEPVPTLSVGASGPVVSSLQKVVTNGALVQRTAPGPIDGTFRPLTRTSVKALQALGGAATDGILGDQTWSVSLHAASATREIQVGLEFVIG
jgi:peptidoglycan hydrolase-like protein with peptidoglycan-binding domain